MSKQGKSRLGRGLSSLISMPIEREIESVGSSEDDQSQDVAMVASATMSAVPIVRDEVGAPRLGAPTEIPIDRITPNPHQPRRQFNEASLNELAASLKSNGMIQPILVRPVSDGEYQLVAGERRLRAARIAGLSAIPAIVRQVDSFTQAQLALVENIHRENLNPIERASGYKALIEQLGLTQAELAQRLGEDRTTVAHFIRLMELPEAVRNLIRDEKLSLGHAKVLAGVSEAMEQERLANLALSHGLSVRNLERLVNSASTPPASRPKPALSAHLGELEKSFARQLGMRVQIRSAGGSKSKGRVVIHYASLDQFDRLMELLEVQGYVE